MPLTQLERVEKNFQALTRRTPDLPFTESLILRAASILGRDINAMIDRVLKPFGLAEPEFRLLMAVHAHGGSAGAGDLCAALAQSPANLTRISDSLVERGFLSRSLDADDRRRILIALMPAGEELILRLLPHIGPGVRATFDGFTAAEKKQLLAGLKRLMAGVDAQAARDGARDEVA